MIPCTVISVCLYRCSRAIAYKARINSELRRINIIDQFVVMNVVFIAQEQINELMINNNNLKITEMKKKELRPIRYKDSLKNFIIVVLSV